MGAKTGIEWTESTWTPIRARHRVTGKVGWHCIHASPGCKFCYSEGINHRLGTGLPFRPDQADSIELFLDEQMLLAPLRWKKPRMIFVCSMTDLFADFVPDDWIDRIFAVMALCPQHTFQVLTKRADRMRQYSREPSGGLFRAVSRQHRDHDGDGALVTLPAWPLPNVWLGVSVEDQRRADERIPHLLDAPAAVRFLSCEPLLGPLRLASEPCEMEGVNWLEGYAGSDPPIPRIDWIICGGESGRNARPMHPEWARGLRDQCVAAGVPFFFKQWGEWIEWQQGGACRWHNETPQRPSYSGPGVGTLHDNSNVLFGGRAYPTVHTSGDGATTFCRVGKKAAGAMLDGREWRQMLAAGGVDAEA